MSGNLNYTEVAENQSAKEVTMNAAFGKFDDALTELLTLSGAAGNITMTDAQYRECVAILASPVTVAARDLTLRAIKGFKVVMSAAANTFNVTVKLGSASRVIVPGEKITVYIDGTANGMSVVSSSVSTPTVITVQDEGSGEVTVLTNLNFVGAGVDVTPTGGSAQVNIAGGGGGAVEVDEEGVSEVAAATILNFVGAGVTVNDLGGGEAEITIPGGSGSGDERTRSVPAIGDFPTWVNQDSATGQDRAGADGVEIFKASVGSSVSIHAKVQALPGGNWSAIFLVRRGHAFRNYFSSGVCIRDSVGGKIIAFGSDNVGNLTITYFDSATAFNANVLSPLEAWSHTDAWLRIDYDGTNNKYYASTTGHDDDWMLLATLAKTAFLGATANQIGFYANDQQASGTGPVAKGSLLSFEIA